MQWPVLLRVLVFAVLDSQSVQTDTMLHEEVEFDAAKNVKGRKLLMSCRYLRSAMLNNLRFFVYGTLKPGEANYDRYCAGKVVEYQRAIAMGLLFALPMGFPATIPGTQPVHGFLLTFRDPTILATLDLLEGYHGGDRPDRVNLYNRIQIEVFALEGLSLGLAWAYFMTPEQVQQFGGQLLPDGCWTSL